MRATLALGLLSAGVGATTAAFALVNRLAPHATHHADCETLVTLASGPTIARTVGIDVREPVGMGERMTDMRDVVYESASDDGLVGDGLAIDVRDLASSRAAVLAMAGAALALLVACARGAATLARSLNFPAATMAVTGGAIASAAFALRMIGVSRLDARTTAFALCIALLAVVFARGSRRLAGSSVR